MAASPRPRAHRMPPSRGSKDGCGQVCGILAFMGALGGLAWLSSLEGPARIAAISVLGSIVLFTVIGAAYAMRHRRRRGEIVPWLCWPFTGVGIVIMSIFLLPLLIKAYCIRLCRSPPQSTTDTQKAADQAYAAGWADAERAAADAAAAAKPTQPEVTVVQGTVLVVPVTDKPSEAPAPDKQCDAACDAV